MNESVDRYISYMYSYPHKTAYRTFEKPLDIRTFIRPLTGRTASLYFHIPFCRHKCGYCNLFSLSGCQPEIISKYLDAMERQAIQLSSVTNKLIFNSFAIGGGTPLLLSPAQLERLFNLAALFGVNPSSVFTSIETSPLYAGKNILTYLKEQGVKRISIGIQSFIPEELKNLKRTIPLSICLEALEHMQQVGFPQFNIDLMYGIKGQTVESFLYSINKALSFQPTELFIYPLYVRPGTGLQTKEEDQSSFEMYQVARSLLVNKGFLQTSMRRFTREKEEDTEFSCGDDIMLSCGAGGRSYLGDLHTATPYTVNPLRIKKMLEQYINITDHTRITHGILLSEEEKKRRFIIKNLMFYRGLNIGGYTKLLGESPDNNLFTHFIEKGWITKENGVIRLTEEGLGWSDKIGESFISPDIRKRMDEFVF